jgi:multimeric flavodoxin WrbA
MKVIIVSGSRNPDGQTAAACKALLDGVLSAGGEGNIIYLPAMNIERCRQCNDDGWGICITEGRCTISDDLDQVADEIRGADIAVFATPVYFAELSESIRAFLDRLRRTCMADQGKQGIRGKKAIGICVAGGGGGGAPTCCVVMERALGTTGFDVVDMIPARRQNLQNKLPLLKEIGKNLVEQN